jgi:hypothetical protein
VTLDTDVAYFDETDLIEIDLKDIKPYDKPTFETKKILRFGELRYQVRCFEAMTGTNAGIYFEIRDLNVKQPKTVQNPCAPFVVFGIEALPEISSIFANWTESLRKSIANVKKALKVNNEKTPYTKWLRCGNKHYVVQLQKKDNGEVFASICEKREFNPYQNNNANRSIIINCEALPNFVLALQHLE